MEKIIRKIKKGEDHATISYWLSQTYQQRMADLEAMREQQNFLISFLIFL
ncbi:MAG: hypothetical protein RI894_750 [Bacteroidota bacterium]|jgi:hypothetical protein